MKRPSLLARLAGIPLVALLLLIIYGVIILGWYQGRVVWWVALAALLLSMRTLSAVRQLRRYKAWRAEWDAMSAEPSRVAKKTSGGWPRVIAALIVFVAITTWLPQIQHAGTIPNAEVVATALTWLWMVAGLYLAWRLLRLVWGGFRRITRRSEVRQDAKMATAPVTWLLPRASSSPSRAEAQANLPEYASRLIDS